MIQPVPARSAGPPGSTSSTRAPSIRLVEVLLPAEAKRVAVLATSTGDEAWGGAVVEIPRD